MTFEQYQDEARKTAIYKSPMYPYLGLVSEAGEVAGKIKKILRDKDGVLSMEDKVQLSFELGDVLWYIANIASDLNIDLADIASANLSKLNSRLSRGVIQGSGDNR